MTSLRTIIATVSTRSRLGQHAGSQTKARRNALLASTALAQRSHERREVEEFLLAHARARTGGEQASVATST